jgi:Polyketide cyclase / dehydrase and lipid transport
MKREFGFAAGLLLLAAVPAFAVESRVVGTSAAAPDKVWAKIGDFCGISNWHPVVEKCTLSADGSIRTLDLKGGGAIHEKLENRDDAGHSYTYSIIDSPLPVANYSSTISVAADGAGSKITWIGKFDAKGASDAEAMKVMNGVYQAGIDALVK